MEVQFWDAPEVILTLRCKTNACLTYRTTAFRNEQAERIMRQFVEKLTAAAE